MSHGTGPHGGVLDDLLHEREQSVEALDVAMPQVGAGYGIAIAPAA